LWTGYAYPPAEPGTKHDAVERWKEHLFENICGGSLMLYQWALSYFAHLIQRPYEKPSVALVLRGAKGVGKNACVERVAALLGPHAMVTADSRYLTSHFNGHLENCLMLVFDEAFWSGNKQAEGQLKNLITGREHVIEHKGCESFRVANLTRVVILSNDAWAAPASHDERRFFVLDVKEHKKQNTAYFGPMIEGMEQGGYPVLLRYLRDYECDLVDLRRAPTTEALQEQKGLSMTPLEAWWEECLTSGHIAHSTVEGWPEEIECTEFRHAFQRYVKDRNITGWTPADRVLGKEMRKFVPRFDRVRATKGGSRPWAYRLPELSEARQKWDQHWGHTSAWPE
jgi:hypothetical protein